MTAAGISITVERGPAKAPTFITTLDNLDTDEAAKLRALAGAAAEALDAARDYATQRAAWTAARVERDASERVAGAALDGGRLSVLAWRAMDEAHDRLQRAADALLAAERAL